MRRGETNHATEQTHRMSRVHRRSLSRTPCFLFCSASWRAVNHQLSLRWPGEIDANVSVSFFLLHTSARTMPRRLVSRDSLASRCRGPGGPGVRWSRRFSAPGLTGSLLLISSWQSDNLSLPPLLQRPFWFCGISLNFSWKGRSVAFMGRNWLKWNMFLLPYNHLKKGIFEYDSFIYIQSGSAMLLQ